MEWQEKFDKEFNQSLHASCKMWVDADKEIKNFIGKLLEEQKKEYDNLYFEVSMLRQMIGDGLDDVDKIYQKLNQLTPLMSDEEKKKMDKHLRETYPSLYKLKE
jgi:hypothetical protein